MPLLLNYTDNPITENETTVTMDTWPLDSPIPRKKMLGYVIKSIGCEKRTTVSWVLPDSWLTPTFPQELGEVIRGTDWDRHPTHVLTLVCSSPEMYEAINRYFQGSWHL